MKLDGQCCGKCKWHHQAGFKEDWVCVNEDSEYCTDYTPYGFCCDEYEEREPRKRWRNFGYDTRNQDHRTLRKRSSFRR